MKKMSLPLYCKTCSRVVAVSTLGSILAFCGTGQKAAWANCTNVGSTYTCSGVTTIGQGATGLNLQVTAISSFQSTVTGGIALGYTNSRNNFIFTQRSGSSITTIGNGVTPYPTGVVLVNGPLANNLTVTNESGATVTAAGVGIDAINNGRGNTRVSIGGTVTGVNFDGLYVQNGSEAYDITVDQTSTASTISGGVNGVGIHVKNFGGGNTSITTRGMVVADGYDAINVENSFGTAAPTDTLANDLTINQISGALISTNEEGIHAYNYGTGNTVITTAGTVTGGVAGIHAGNGLYANDLTINQTGGTITGIGTSVHASPPAYLGSGIYAENHGIGNTNINTAGDVTGQTLDGIYVLNTNAGNYTNDINVNQTAGTVTGAQHGIYAENQTVGSVTINSSSTITGGSGSGIYTESLAGQQVTISLNSGSNVSASSGMAITDTAGEATVNVNSGSTLSGEVHLGNGSDTLNINGGANISAATILDGGDDRTTGDGYVDVINFNGVNQSLQGGRIVNWELMNLNSSLLTITDGTLAVGDGTTGTGVFLNNGSTLDGSNSLALDANLGIDRSSTFELTGNGSGDYSVSYNLTNAGTLNMADGVVGDHLSVGGDYVSDGSVMLVDVDFNPLTADYMTVDGKVSGNGTIAIHDITTGYSYSKGEILLIEETTDSNKADESFVLAPANRYNGASDLGRFTSTPFIWRLKTTGNDWVLGYAFDAPQETTPTKTKNSAGGTATATTSTGKHAVVSEIPAYISLPSFSYEMVNNELDTLHMRLGELRHFRPTVGSPDLLGLRSYDPSIEFDESKINGWARVTYANFKFEPDKNFEMNGEYGATNLGFDKKIKLQDSALFTGIFGGISRGRFSNDGRGSEFGSLYEADTDIDAWSLGLYATWFGSQGYYLDLVGEYMGMDADIEAVDHYQTDGHMLGFSAELGKSYEVREDLVLEPQAQLKVADVAWDGFNDGWNDVSFADHTYLTGRLGLRGEYTTHAGKDGQAEIKPWLYAGIQHEFTDAPDVTYVIDFESHQYDTTANIQAGITAHLAKWMQLYGDAGLTSNFDDYYSMRLDCGLRLKW